MDTFTAKFDASLNSILAKDQFQPAHAFDVEALATPASGQFLGAADVLLWPKTVSRLSII